MSQESSVSLPSSSQSTEGGAPAPAPTSQWKIWSRGINKDGDWYCTHKFADNTQTFHYVNKDGTVYLRHRDDSATSIPTEGTYNPSRARDSDSKIPAPTMEEIIEEYKQVKKEHAEYLARPLKYWDGVCTTLQPRRRSAHPDIAWLFPICDCGDRYESVYDDDYPGYPDDDYEGDYDPDNEYDRYYDGVWGESRDSEDEEEDYSDHDRSSQSSDEDEEIVKQEDDKTIVPVADAPRPSAVMETKVDVKQETKEEILNGPFIARFVDSKLEILAGTVPGATPVECAATESGTGEQASTSSEIGPDVQTEGKRILRSHRAKPY